MEKGRLGIPKAEEQEEEAQVNHYEFLAAKGGALKYSLQYDAKPKWDKEFAEPLKAHVLTLPTETLEVAGGKLWIRRPSGKRVFCAKKITQDVLGLAKGGGLKMPDIIQLLEAGMLTVVPTKEIAVLTARRSGRQLRGYTTWKPAGSPELRWPVKGVLAQWNTALRVMADLTVHIARAAAAKPIKTIEKLLLKK